MSDPNGTQAEQLVEVVNQQKGTHVPVKILDDSNPDGIPIEVLIEASDNEFLGQKDVEDQILWRRRSDPIWIHVLKHGKRKWVERPLHKLPTSWDGKIYLAKTSQFNQAAVRTVLESSAMEDSAEDSLEDALLLNLRYGRGAICSSFEGKWASIVIRGGVTGGATEDTAPQSWADSEWAPSAKPKGEFPVAIQDYVDALAEVILKKDNSPCSGLIVLMAETSAGKSKIAYGLMHYYLNELHNELHKARENPKPQFLHAVTLEDPIETQAYKLTADSTANYPACAVPKRDANDKLSGPLFTGIHYTARHKRHDTNLIDGLNDCLRQKPAVVCVGEIRDLTHWKAVLEFAGTGHLVVATAHAGHLSEAMGKILNACEARTPAKRGDVASKILAMVQLELVDIEPPAVPQQQKVTLMTVWRRKNGGASGLVSEGLDSIEPHFSDDKGVLGAQMMCEKLKGVVQEREKKAAQENPLTTVPLPQEFWREVMNKAREHDTRGL